MLKYYYIGVYLGCKIAEIYKKNNLCEEGNVNGKDFFPYSAGVFLYERNFMSDN